MATYTLKIGNAVVDENYPSPTISMSGRPVWPSSSCSGLVDTAYYCYTSVFGGVRYYSPVASFSAQSHVYNNGGNSFKTSTQGDAYLISSYESSRYSGRPSFDENIATVGSTRTYSNGSTVYDGYGTALTVSITENVVIEKFIVTVKKTNGRTTTTVSETQYDEGSNVTVNIPSGYTNHVLSGVSKDGASLYYNDVKNGYKISNLSQNVEIIYAFAALNTITVSVGTGAQSITASSITLYTGETSSVTKTSGSGSITAQANAPITFGATAATNYVFTSTSGIVTSSPGYSAMHGTGTASISNQVQDANGDATFTATGEQFTITPSIVDGGTGKSAWGTAKIREQGAASWSTGATVLKPSTTYELGFDSATENTLAAVVDYWAIGGSNYSTTFTTESTVTGDVTAHLYLRQTKWQLTVSNGTSAEWGSVYIGASGTDTSGWFANGSSVSVRFVSAMASTYAPRIQQVIYAGTTTQVHGQSTTVTTTNADGQVLVQLEKTKCLFSVQFASGTAEGVGTIGGGGVYVQNGSQVTLTFAPNPSLVQTVHPQAAAWSFSSGQQQVSVTSNQDGSSSTVVTLSVASVVNDIVASCLVESAWRKVSIQRSDAFAAGWGTFYLGSSGTATTGYYAPGTQVTMRFARDANFDLKERPQVNALAIGTEHTVSGVDGTYEYQYTLPANVKTDLVITGSLKQTAWPVSVTSAGNGTVTASRVDIATSAVIGTVSSTGTAATIYLRTGTTAEYLSLSTSPSAHYAFGSWTKTNLSTYGGNAANVQLTTAANASVSASFARSDFKVTATSDMASVCDTYMQDNAASEAYYPLSTATNPVVVCKVKAAYSDPAQYRVASFTVGATTTNAQYNSDGGFYYVEITSDYRSDVVVTAHVVATNFDLAINVGPNNKADFGTVIMSANGQQIKDLTADNFSGKVREGTRISVVFYQKYGGRISENGIQPSSEIENPTITSNGIEFDMPSAACSVAITLGPKSTYQLTVGIRNLAPGQSASIPGIVTVRSRTYPDTIIGATSVEGTDSTFSVYRDEEYSLVVTPVSDSLSRRFVFTGWRNASGAISGATDTTLNILNSDASVSALSRFAGYNARENGTITIEWAKKVNDEIVTPSAAELADITSRCSFDILNTEDKYDATHWLIGTDITIPYEVKGAAYDYNGDAYKWTPIEVDVAEGTDPYATNESWDDGLLTQGGSFLMLGNMRVRVVLTHTMVAGFTTMHVGYKQSTALMGEVSIFSTAMDAYTQDSTGATVLAQKQKKAVIMAAPRPGFAFAGWFTYANGAWTAVAGAKAVYEIALVTSPMTVYYAQFVASTVSNVKMWNGNEDVAKTCEWQSKVFVGSQFFQLAACRVYADAYPVTLKIMMSSSPDGVFATNARTATVTIANQNPRRLPMVRPEKYLAFKVTGYSRVNHVGIASSMEALK